MRTTRRHSGMVRKHQTSDAQLRIGKSQGSGFVLRPPRNNGQRRIGRLNATYALLLFGALAGGFVSGLAGFGTALMALGIWLYVLPPAIAVPLVLICSVVAQISTLPSIWKAIDFSIVWPFLVGGLIGVPLGTMLIADADPKVFKLNLGLF